MTPGLTIEEKIIQDILTDLTAITAGSLYYSTVARVYRMTGAAIDRPELPAIIILHDGTTKDYSRLGMVISHLNLKVVCATRFDDGWQTTIANLMTDVEKVLTSDYTRAGNAFDTWINSTTIANEEETLPMALGQLDAVVKYRYSNADMTVAM